MPVVKSLCIMHSCSRIVKISAWDQLKTAIPLFVHMQYWSLPTSNKEGGKKQKNILHHEKTGAVDVEVIFKKILLPPSPESWLHVVLHHVSPVALREQEREGKNAGTLLINKAALLSGEVECVYFYP